MFENNIEELQSDDLELVFEQSYSEPNLDGTSKCFQDNNMDHSDDMTNKTKWGNKASDLQNAVTPSLKRNNKIRTSEKKSPLSKVRRRHDCKSINVICSRGKI